MIGENKVLEMFNFVQRDALAERRDGEGRRQCKQRSTGMNQEQPIAMESCTARYVGILAAGLNSISRQRPKTQAFSAVQWHVRIANGMAASSNPKGASRKSSLPPRYCSAQPELGRRNSDSKHSIHHGSGLATPQVTSATAQFERTKF